MLFDERDKFAAFSARLRAMQGKEISQYAKSDYLSDEGQRRLVGAAVDEFGADARIRASPASIHAWRHECIEWSYGAMDILDYDREIVSLAASYMDRFLERRSVDKPAFKVTMLAALYLAIKLSVPRAGAHVLRSLLWRACDEFSPEDVAVAERDLLAVLDWRVHAPTPAAFCQEFLNLLPAAVSPAAREEVRETAEYLIELSILDYVLSTRKRPSSVALAALIVAMEQKGPVGVEPAHKTELLQRVAAAGVDTGGGNNIVQCRARLLFHLHL